MLDKIPNEKEMTLLGKSLYDVWNKLRALIDERCDMDSLWDKDGLIDERLKFETEKDNYSKEVQEVYDEAQIYYDGKWKMFEPVDTSLFNDFIRLLQVKRKQIVMQLPVC